MVLFLNYIDRIFLFLAGLDGSFISRRRARPESMSGVSIEMTCSRRDKPKQNKTNKLQWSDDELSFKIKPY